MGLFAETPEKRGEKIAKLLLGRSPKEVTQAQINALLDKGVVLRDAYNDQGILSLAIFNHHQRLINYCIKHKIGLNARSFYGGMPIMSALDRGKSDVAMQLITAGADTRVTENYERTVLMKALCVGDLAIARRLVKKKLSLHDRTSKGYSCVNAALESGKPEVLEYVLAAKPSLTNIYDSKSILFAAIDTKNPRMFDMLVTAGCKIDIQEKGPWGQTLLSYAKDNAHKDIKAKLNAIAAEKREIKEAAEKVARTGWRLTGEHEISHIEEPDKIPYKVTQVFNFYSGLYTRINHNLETKAESTAVMNISDIASKEFVATAEEQLKSLGGTVPPEALEGLSSARPAVKSVIAKPTGATP